MYSYQPCIQFFPCFSQRRYLVTIHCIVLRISEFMDIFFLYFIVVKKAISEVVLLINFITNLDYSAKVGKTFKLPVLLRTGIRVSSVLKNYMVVWSWQVWWGFPRTRLCLVAWGECLQRSAFRHSNQFLVTLPIFPSLLENINTVRLYISAECHNSLIMLIMRAGVQNSIGVSDVGHFFWHYAK